MKQEVRQQIGVTFSVGVAPNKLLAKIASNVHKPDGLTSSNSKTSKLFFLRCLLIVCWVWAEKTVEKMAELGIKTVADLAAYDVQRLIEIFGKTLGIYFHQAANGVDNEPVEEAAPAESIGRMNTLKADTRDVAFIMETIDRQIEEIQKEYTAKNLSFRQVGIYAVMTDLSSKSRSKTLDKPAKDKETIHRAAQELFEKYLGETELEIRRVGVKVGGLLKRSASKGS
jgi:DNA polymerase IV (DinB-like DNA polymerase)